MTRCLFCYLPLAENELDFHGTCSKKIFGQPTPPALPYSEADFEPLAKEVKDYVDEHYPRIIEFEKRISSNR
jgi:hypothetical protein